MEVSTSHGLGGLLIVRLVGLSTFNRELSFINGGHLWSASLVNIKLWKINMVKGRHFGHVFPLLFANLTVRPLRTLVRDHEHFIPSKFRKHPLSSSVVNMVKADYVFPYIYMH